LSIIEYVPHDYLHVLTQITSKKYIIKITLIFSNDFKINIIALFDTCADLNCIKKGIIQKWLIQNTFKKLSAANDTKLVIKYKTQVLIFNKIVETSDF